MASRSPEYKSLQDKDDKIDHRNTTATSVPKEIFNFLRYKYVINVADAIMRSLLKVF